MKKIVLFLLMIGCGLACKQKEDVFTMKSDDPAYELATLLSEKVSQLDPQINRIIVSTAYFEMGTNEVMHTFRNIYGKESGSLNNLPADRLRMEVEKLAHDLSLEKLIMRDVKKSNIRLDQSAVDSVLEMYYNRSGSREGFLKELEEKDIQYEFVVSDIREGLMIDRFIRSVVYTQVDPPSDQELKKLFAEAEKELRSFRVLVLSTRDKAEEEITASRSEIEQIWHMAKEGVPFEDLIEQYSEDEISGLNVGLYEDLERSMMDPVIAEAVFETPVGEISNVFETADGLNIVKTESVHTLDFAQFKQKNYETVWQKRKNKAYQDYIKKVKNEADFIFYGL